MGVEGYHSRRAPGYVIVGSFGIIHLRRCCRSATKTPGRRAFMLASVYVTGGLVMRIIAFLFQLRGGGRLLLPSQPSRSYRDSSALKVRE